MGLKKVSYDVSRDKPACTEIYQTRASTVFRECLAFVGGLQLLNGRLVYVRPARQIDSGLPCLTATADVDYETDGSIASDLCLMTVTYGIPETSEDTELGSISIEVAGDLLQLERGAFKWTSGPKTGLFLSDNNDVQPFLVVPGGTLKYKNNFAVDPDLSGLTALYGMVSGADIVFPGVTQPMPAGYCRYDGFGIERKLSMNAYNYFEVTHSFALAGHDWNQLFDGTTYSTVNPPLYNVTDLNVIFAS